MDADAVYYSSTDTGRPMQEVIDEICMILAAGKNLVGTQLMLLTAGYDADYGAQIRAACEAGSSSFYQSGPHGDFNLAMLAALITNCRKGDTVSTAEVPETEQPGNAYFDSI